MIEKRVVTPEDLGETIKLGVLQPDKYDVVITASGAPASVSTDTATLGGNGTSSSPLRVNVSSTAGNAVVTSNDGLFVAAPTVVLTNATGKVRLGLIHSAEDDVSTELDE